MAAQPRILVVDDDSRIAAAVRRALVYEGYAVDVAGDGRAALDSAATLPPDVVVLDVMLPDIDGMEVCRRLRADGDVPILMLTARDGVTDRVRGLDTGADDYLVKPFAHEELLARVRALLRRRATAPGGALSHAGLTLDPAAHEVTRDGRVIDLTALEFQLLEHFLRHPRHVLTRDQLLEAVWGFDAETTSNLVDVYVGYLRTKLESAGEPRLIQTVRGVGYVLREP
ncbi:MAG TPA: response regulator transcription factor [Dehalococcoidia bacterium]